MTRVNSSINVSLCSDNFIYATRSINDMEKK